VIVTLVEQLPNADERGRGNKGETKKLTESGRFSQQRLSEASASRSSTETVEFSRQRVGIVFVETECLRYDVPDHLGAVFANRARLRQTTL
jgi:hypothetical protein